MNNLRKKFKRFYLLNSLRNLERVATDNSSWYANLEVINTSARLVRLNTDLIDMTTATAIDTHRIYIAFREISELESWLDAALKGLTRISIGVDKRLPNEVSDIKDEYIDHRAVSVLFDEKTTEGLEKLLDLIIRYTSDMILLREQMPYAYVGYVDLRMKTGLKSLWEIIEVLLRIAIYGDQT